MQAVTRLPPMLLAVTCSLSLMAGDGENLHWFLLGGAPSEASRLMSTLPARSTAAGAAIAAGRTMCSDDAALR